MPQSEASDLFPVPGKPSQLLIKYLLDRSQAWVPEQKIVYRDLKEITYSDLYQRIMRLANVLTGLGVGPGDRVGVMDYDSHRYLEMFFAVPMIGAVLHTINFRLSPEQALFTIAHAEDRLLIVHKDFLPLLEQRMAQLPDVCSIVLITDDGRRPESQLRLAGDYEDLLAGSSPEHTFQDFDENTVATLFYTTGTTGEPKGVFFTHRQIVLHTLGIGLALTAAREPLSFGCEDTYMPLTPMFHVHAWGIPYYATMLGVKQVYPGRYEPLMLLNLIARHKVTFSHGVPTILQMLINHPASRSIDLSNWKIVIGGAPLARSLAKQAMDRGVRVLAGYGMSETCPAIALAQVKPSLQQQDPEGCLEVITRTGFPLPLVQAKIMDGNGNMLPPGEGNLGELVLQAPWLTMGYFKQEEKSRELWRGGWLHTGDLAYVDESGYVRITDRLKDVVKVGGEWISSMELESAISRHEAVKEVAVVGVPDPKWNERPHAYVVLHEASVSKVTPKDLIAFLRTLTDQGALHKRAILTEIHLVDAIPKTSVGKLDKKALRARSRSAPGEGEYDHRRS